MHFSEKLAIWFREKPILPPPEKSSQHALCTPPSHLFPSRNRIHFCCSNRLLSSPNKNSHQLLHFSLSKSANTTISLFNLARQIHRPHPLVLKCFRETTHRNVRARKTTLRVSNTSYCLLHEKDVFIRVI